MSGDRVQVRYRIWLSSTRTGYSLPADHPSIRPVSTAVLDRCNAAQLHTVCYVLSICAVSPAKCCQPPASKVSADAFRRCRCSSPYSRTHGRAQPDSLLLGSCGAAGGGSRRPGARFLQAARHLGAGCTRFGPGAVSSVMTSIDHTLPHTLLLLQPNVLIRRLRVTLTTRCTLSAEQLASASRRAVTATCRRA